MTRYLRSMGRFSGHKIHKYDTACQRSFCGRVKASAGVVIDAIRFTDVLCYRCFPLNDGARQFTEILRDVEDQS